MEIKGDKGRMSKPSKLSSSISLATAGNDISLYLLITPYNSFYLHICPPHWIISYLKKSNIARPRSAVWTPSPAAGGTAEPAPAS